jgi:hypothetical protein
MSSLRQSDPDLEIVKEASLALQTSVKAAVDLVTAMVLQMNDWAHGTMQAVRDVILLERDSPNCATVGQSAVYCLKRGWRGLDSFQIVVDGVSLRDDCMTLIGSQAKAAHFLVDMQTRAMFRDLLHERSLSCSVSILLNANMGMHDQELVVNDVMAPSQAAILHARKQPEYHTRQAYWVLKSHRMV